MRKPASITAMVAALAVLLAVVAQTSVGTAFQPAAARDLAVGAPSVPPTPAAVGPLPSDRPVSLLPATTEPQIAAPAAVEPTASPEPAAPAVTAADPSVAVAPVAAAPVRTATPVLPAPTAAPTQAPPPPPAACPATWFCYPRLGIAGAIVPYSDCSGSTDIGTSIRSFSCISPFYLMGHAYTQFGKITQWRAGDVVTASGRSFTITGAFTQNSCEAPARAPAPLSLQTSLGSGGCGSVLVVQGN